MAWGTWLRGAGLAAVLAALLWAAAAQAQERPVLALVEAGSERLVVGWTWVGGDDPAAFSVHWRRRVSGAAWESAQADGAARRFEITGLRPDSAYIVRVRALDAEGRGIRAPGGSRPFDLRGVFDTIQLPVPDAPRISFDGERATASWNAVEGATGYELAWGLAGGETATERLGADALEFATGALAAGSRYEFRLRSLHQLDRSAPSAAASLTTAAWPHPAPRARFEFHRAAGMLVEWDAVAGVNDYVVAWQKEGDDSRAGETAATGTSVLATREGGFFTGAWLLRVRAAEAGTWSETTRIWVDSPAPELRFSLESSRDLCTEGTLTEIRWRGGGGGGNLWPHVNGRMIGENTYRVKVNCGLIPRTEDGEIDESQRDAVITGFLRDGRGTIKSASIRVPRAEALPVPMNLRSNSGIGWMQIFWDAVAGAGAQSPAVGAGTSDRASYAIRHRSSVTADWETVISYSSPKHSVEAWSTSTSTDQTSIEVSVAALRHPIELETSAALQWAPSLTVVSLTPPQNLSATTTHDTLTVQFDRQPHGSGGSVQVSVPGRSGGLGEIYWEDGSSGRHEIVFAGLPPDTNLEIIVDAGRSYEPFSKITARTLPAPPNWTAPQHGPQNLRATPRSTSINVQWDLPNNDVQHGWFVAVRDITGGGNAPIATRRLTSGTTEVEIQGGGVYWSVGPGRTYRIQVLELGLVHDHVSEMVVTTPTLPEVLPQRSSTDSSATGLPEAPILFFQFVPQWPVRIENGHYMTDDPWVFRGHRFHAGLDIGGLPSLQGNAGRYVYASEDGYIQILNDDLLREDKPELLYCDRPDTPFIDRFKSFDKEYTLESWELADGTQVQVRCDRVVTRYSGRTAVIYHTLSSSQNYLTKYSHLKEGSINQTILDKLDHNTDKKADRDARTFIHKGQLIGMIGGSGAAAMPVDKDCEPDIPCETGYHPHLHFEIRTFDGTLEDRFYTKEDTTGCNYIDYGVDGHEYCEAMGTREMGTVIDPETVLSPLPASDIPRDPGVSNAIRNANNNPKRHVFELTRVSGVPDQTVSTARLDISIGIWRPSFYSRYMNCGVRCTLKGIQGTEEGVTAYYSTTSCADPNVVWMPSDREGDPDSAGELPRQPRNIVIAEGTVCHLRLITSNERYGAYTTPITPMRTDVEVSDPTMKASLNSNLKSNVPVEARLSNIDFHVYEIRAQADSLHAFSVKTRGMTKNEVVLRLWKDGVDMSGDNRKDKSKIENWTASVTGTVFLSIEGAVQSDNRRWSGTYEISYSEIAPLAVDATANPVTCLPDGKTTISWTVTGGTGGVTVTVSGVTTSFNTRTGSTEVTCQGTEGQQTVLVSVTDSAREPVSKSVSVNVRVLRPICVPPPGGVSGQAATDGSTPDSATCKPPAPTLASSSTATSSSITASWSAATGATLHKVQIGETPSSGTATYGSEQTPSGSGGTSHTFTGLTANKNYSIRVTAYNGAIAGGSDEASGFWTKPAAPANLRVTSRQPTSLTITWTAISGLTYKVQRSGRTTWSTPSGTGTHKFTGLTAGATYTLKVRAENTAGASTPSSTKPTTPSVLSATLSPTSANCQTGNTVRLTWTATGGTAPYTSTPSSNPYTYRCSSTGSKTVTFTIKDSGTPKQSVTKQARITVTSPPAPPPPTCSPTTRPSTSSSRVSGIEREWRLSAGTWLEYVRDLVQPQRRTASWIGHPTCRWQTGPWADHGTATPGPWRRGTDDRPQRRVTEFRAWQVEWPSKAEQETRWTRVFANAVCHEHEEKLFRRFVMYRDEDISWSSSAGWTATPAGWRGVMEDPAWRRTGESRLCVLGPAGSDGQQRISLAAGTHLIVLGDVLTSVTIAAESGVTLAAREIRPGVTAAVFASQSGAEMIVDPATLSVDSPNTALTSTDPVLATVAASLRVVGEPAQVVDAPICPRVERTGTTAVDVSLETADCSIVAGGSTNVSDASRSLSVTLPTGRDWIIVRARFAATDAGESFWFTDSGTGSYVAIDPATRAEVSRLVAEDAPTEMAGWLDAIVGSASVVAPEASDNEEE